MEHYKKKQSRYIEDALRPNELRITGAGKAHDLTSKAAELLKVRTILYEVWVGAGIDMEKKICGWEDLVQE